MGLKMVQANARVIMPDFLNHPEFTQPSTWRRPEDLGLGLPSRHDFLLDAIRPNTNGLAFLGDAFFWKGTTNDFFQVYPEGSEMRSNVMGRSLARDYFPHGGLVGAARLSIPALLTDRPPFEKFKIVADSNANPLDRLGAAGDIIQNYVLAMHERGTLGFYLPAPNPPFLYDQEGRPLGQTEINQLKQNFSPQEILNTIQNFDINKIKTGKFFSIEHAFLRGYIDGQLLGVPIARVDMVGQPADPEHADAYFRITAFMPTNSWLTNFVDSANLKFEITQSPTNTLERRFSNLLSQVIALTNVPPAQQNQALMTQKALEITRSFASEMPKVSLVATLSNLHFPPIYSDFITLPSVGANFQMVAYSPEFEPDFVGSGPIAEARRRGGIAIQGNVNVGGFFNIENAELLIAPQGNGVPQLTARLNAPSLALPNGVGFHNVLIDIDSASITNLSATGNLSGFEIGSLIQLRPRSGNAIGMSVQVVRNGSGGTDQRYVIDPSVIEFPALQSRVLIHGSNQFTPFIYSTAGPWMAAATLENGITLLDQYGDVALEVDGTITGSVAGNGPNSTTLTLQLNGPLTVQIYPGKSQGQTLNLASAAQLVVGPNLFSLSVSNAGGGIPGMTPQAGPNFSIRRDENGTKLIVDTAQIVLSEMSILPLAGLDRLRAELTILSPTDWQVEIDPARVVIPNISGEIRIHGASSATNRFIYSPTGIWDASLTMTGTLQLRDQFTNVALEATATGFGGSIYRDLTGLVELTMQLPQSLALTFYPGKTWARTLTLSANSSLVVRNDRTFSLSVANAGGTIEGLPAAPGGGFWISSTLNNGTRRTSTRLEISPIDLPGIFSIQSQTAAPLGVELEVGGVNSVTLRVDASRLVIPPLLTTVSIHGASINDPFVFSTTGPWAAGLTLQNGFDLRDLNNDVALRLASGPLSGTITRTLTPDLFEASITLPANLNLSIYPEKTFSQTVRYGGSVALKVASDGSFDLLGQLGASVNLNGLSGLPLGSLDSNTELQLTDDFFRFTYSGTVAGQFSGALATGTLVVSNTGQTTLTGTVSIPPIDVGPFHLTGSGGGNLSATLTSSSLLLSGVFLKVDDLFENVALPQIPVLNNGDFDQTFTLPNLTVGGFNLGTVDFTLKRRGNVFSIDPFNAIITVPGLNNGSAGTLSLNGTIASDGSLSMTNIVSGNSGFFGYPAAGGMVNIFERRIGNIASLVLADAPVSYWRLNEVFPLTLNDEMARAQGSSQGGILPIPGKFGLSDIAVRLDGNDDYIAIANESSFDFTGSMSVEAWFKVDGFSKTSEAIVTKGDNAWRLQRNGTTRTLSFDTDGLSNLSLAGNKIVDDNQWHHVVAVYDGQNKYLYIDGALDAAIPATGNIAQNNFEVRLGDNAQQAGRRLDGMLDEVALYNKALSATQVLEHFRGAGGISLSTRMHLDFNSVSLLEFFGSINSDGAFVLKATAANLNLGLFPVNNLTCSFSRLAGGAATLKASGSLGLSTLPSALLDGSIASNGQLSFNATVPDGQIAGFDFRNISLRLSGGINSGSTLSATGQVQVLNLPAAQLSGSVSGNGDLDLLASVGSSTLANYPFNNLSLRLERNSTVGTRFSVAGNLTTAGLNANMSGTVSTEGAVSLHFDGALTLGGFQIANGTLDINNNRLAFDGTVNLVADPPGPAGPFDFGDIRFTGAITNNGSFELSGSGSFNIDGHTTDVTLFKFKSGEIFPAGLPNLNFGNLNVDLNNFNLKPDGLSLNGSKSGDSGWVAYLFGFWSRYNWSVDFSMNGGSINAQASGELKWWWQGIGSPNDSTPVPNEQKWSISSGIGSDGVISLDSNNTSPFVDGFDFPVINGPDSRSFFNFNLW